MVEEKCCQFAEKLGAFVLSQQTAFVFPLFYSIYCICMGNVDTSTYYLPLRIAAPFSIDSLLGWYIFWVFQFITGVTYMFSVVATLYFVCCCFYLGALCDHFDHLIESLDDEFRQTFDVLVVRKRFNDIIDHQNTIYELVHGFS